MCARDSTVLSRNDSCIKKVYYIERSHLSINHAHVDLDTFMY